MILRVGPYLYRVNFIPDYVEHQGTQCLGLCDNDEQVITVSQRVSEAEQIQVLCHEYMEAWLYHFGRSTRDKEDYCDLFGMAMAQFVTDLTHQLKDWAQKDLRQPASLAAVPPKHQSGPATAGHAVPLSVRSSCVTRCPARQRLQSLPRIPQTFAVRVDRRLEPGADTASPPWIVHHLRRA